MNEELKKDLEDLKRMLAELEAQISEAETAEPILLTETKDFDSFVKSKGLPVPDGNFIKYFTKSSIAPKSMEMEDVNTKKAKLPTKAEDYTATPEELLQINALSNMDLKAEDVYVFTLKSANTQVDRGYEHFTPKALKSMAKMSIDKPILMNHDWTAQATVGKIFDAKVANDTLIQKAYIPNYPEYQPVIRAILSGLYNKVSVGFAMELKDFVCDSCTKSLYDMGCPHIPGNADEKGLITTATIKDSSDYYETSLIPVPMQAPAGIRRNSLITEIEEDIVAKNFNNVVFTKGGLIQEIVGLPAPTIDYVTFSKQNPTGIDQLANPIVVEAIKKYIEEGKNVLPVFDTDGKLLGLEVSSTTTDKIDIDNILINSNGVNPVPEDNQVAQVTEEKDLIPPAVIAEAPQPEPPTQPAQDPLADILKGLKEAVEALKETVTTQAESIAALVAKQEDQTKTLEKAMEVSDIELARFLKSMEVEQSTTPAQSEKNWLSKVQKALDSQ